jgi:hypothetical protein
LSCLFVQVLCIYKKKKSFNSQSKSAQINTKPMEISQLTATPPAALGHASILVHD